MLPKVNPVNYEQCYPKRLKKIFQSHFSMKTYDRFIPNMENAIVGNIPPELINLFSKETRGKNIKIFQNILADTSRYIRASYDKLRMSGNLTLLDLETYGMSKSMLAWQQSVNNVFNGCLKRLLNTNLTGNLEYIDRGVAGKVFRLSILDKDGNKVMHDKALKVYHNVNFLAYEVRGMHGNYAEANFWTYLKRAAGHRLDKTQFTKHYISDVHSAYSLTEFIDPNITKTTAKIDFQNLFGVKYLDACHNRLCFNKMYDVGGFQKGSTFMDDKVVLRYFKKLFFRSPKELPEVLARYEALAKNPKTPHRNKIQTAIELFKKQYIKKT